MIFGLLIFFQVVVALALVFIVLLQGGRGAELGAAFGSVGQANTVRGSMSGISKVTAVLGAIFMLLSLTLAYLSSEKAVDSVVRDIEAPTVISEPAEVQEAEDTLPGIELEQTDAPPEN